VNGWPKPPDTAAIVQALERDAYAFRELMDPHELEAQELLGETPRTEALRRTARGAVEDWLEAKRATD